MHCLTVITPWGVLYLSSCPQSWNWGHRLSDPRFGQLQSVEVVFFFSLAIRQVSLLVLLPTRHIAYSCSSQRGMSDILVCLWYNQMISGLYYYVWDNCVYCIPCSSHWSGYHWTWCHVLLIMPLLDAFSEVLCFELNSLTLSSPHPHEQQPTTWVF